MTARDRAKAAMAVTYLRSDHGWIALEDAITQMIREAVAAEREACAKLAESQPYYPDTHTGMRQQWVKDQIAAAIRARSEAT